MNANRKRLLNFSLCSLGAIVFSAVFTYNSAIHQSQLSLTYPAIIPSQNSLNAITNISNDLSPVTEQVVITKPTTTNGKIVNTSLSTTIQSPDFQLGDGYMGITNQTNDNLNSSNNNLSQTNSAQFPIEGIDVSKWQNTIDWNQVKASGLMFAYIKSSEGFSYADPNFSTNIFNAKNAHLYVSAYHFARPDLYLQSNSDLLTDARMEATWFVNNVRPYLRTGYLRPVLDLEKIGTLSWSDLSNWTDTFIQSFYTQTGVKPLLYVNSNYGNHLSPFLAKYDLWIAHWTYNQSILPNDGIWTNWQVWQWGGGTVPGISGNVDHNVFNGDISLIQRITINDANQTVFCQSTDCPPAGGRVPL